MSRLTDLITQAKAKDADLGRELEREFKALAGRRSFGLNFERHTPETVELPGRPIRKGDKVRVLPPRGSTEKGDKRLWKVVRTTKVDVQRVADLALIGTDESETQTVPVGDLIVVAEFRDYIYPGLVSTGKVERGGDKPFHTVINGENFHALEALTFTHRGKVDVIYIDPPYNSGAKDWKYNNDYVEKDDLYRHSKWLAFIERRLLVARQLLNPKNSALVATIDEKEYLRFGLLLEQVFPEAKMQMISSLINSKGTGRMNEFRRVDEYVFFLWFGDAKLGKLPSYGKQDDEGKEDDEEREIVPPVDGEDEAGEPTSGIGLDWQTFRRRDLASKRGTKKGGPRQFYPVYVNVASGQIEEIGEPLPHGTPRDQAPEREGCIAVFPIRKDGTEMNWSAIAPTFKERWKDGYARAGKATPEEPQKYIIQYLKGGSIKDIEEGRAVVLGKAEDGSVIAEYPEEKAKTPTTQWALRSHNAEHYGTEVINSLIPGRTFPFPKSLYAVEDALRLFMEENSTAVIVDFFAGSGTTAHAVMRLNRQDGQKRQCISITNNEVEADKQISFGKGALRPGDPDWEKWGICDYITKPRIKAAITGKTPEGKPIKGDYKFTDEFPMADGFEENAEFFTLTYETPVSISHNRAFARIAPLLWMRAGSEGRRIDALPETGWGVADTYGLLTDLDTAAPFTEAVEAAGAIRVAYIVTDDDRRFQSVAQRLPDGVEAVRLYESYLTNFRFAMGR
ncbi:DNA methyltransferase [Loktanella sp. 5RATIMAR09]|uniref:site-specific DNA-methyltransferase n=1 Tax=Loktanella sp. 5RATIMAR09 TaxID=1225655 RepID=UPI0006EBA9D8|nr:DNA methyltransferase [Loktanella sp. 5RATIMAR09]KQI72391.1 DNA methyltransferase [Loktanella sp. 5RATIMAR09]